MALKPVHFAVIAIFAVLIFAFDVLKYEAYSFGWRVINGSTFIVDGKEFHMPAGAYTFSQSERSSSVYSLSSASILNIMKKEDSDISIELFETDICERVGCAVDSGSDNSYGTPIQFKKVEYELIEGSKTMDIYYFIPNSGLIVSYVGDSEAFAANSEAFRSLVSQALR